MSPASQCGGQLLIGHSLSEIIPLQSERFALALRFIDSRPGLVKAALGALMGGLQQPLKEGHRWLRNWFRRLSLKLWAEWAGREESQVGGLGISLSKTPN